MDMDSMSVEGHGRGRTLTLMDGMVDRTTEGGRHAKDGVSVGQWQGEACRGVIRALS